MSVIMLFVSALVGSADERGREAASIEIAGGLSESVSNPGDRIVAGCVRAGERSTNPVMVPVSHMRRRLEPLEHLRSP